MNNNRNNNNRRRGRGNRQQTGGQQLNRIDSRARGNAPQLLEKYRKLAHDAHLNGDRVQAEYYLQFADHYFRVIADQRLRQDEQRLRRDDRWQEGGEGQREENEESGEFSNDGDFPAYDQAPAYTNNNGNRPLRPSTGSGPQDDRGRDDRYEREDRNGWQQQQRPQREERDERPAEEPAEASEATEAAEPSAYEPPENPFVRDNRGTRGLRPRREDRRPPREERDAPGIDPGILPPAIATVSDEPAAAEDEAPAPKKPRGRPRKPRAEDGAGEALESVG